MIPPGCPWLMAASAGVEADDVTTLYAVRAEVQVEHIRLTPG